MKLLKQPAFYGIIVALLGISLMLFGIFRGEISVIFQKAVNICLECIGIG